MIGAEEGCIPDFRAKTTGAIAEEARVLSVMISRARHGVVVMGAQAVPAASTGVAYSKQESQFLTHLRNANPLASSGIVEWVKTTDWDAISVR